MASGGRSTRLRSVLVALIVVALAVVSGVATGFMLTQSAPGAVPDRPVAASSTPAGIVESPTPAPEHRIRIVTRPRGADVEIAANGAETITGTAPMSVEVPEGRLDVTLTHPDRGVLHRQVTVTRDRRFRWWLDPEGQLHHKVAQFKTGPAPKQVAFSPDRRELWVSLLGGPGVEVYRPRTGERLAEIDLGAHGAVEVIFSSDGRTAYASQMESSSVFEIDTATHEVQRQLSTGGAWTKVIALSPDEDRLYASNWSSNDVSEIDLATGDVLRLLPTVATPRGLYVTPDGDALYVAGFAAGQLERIDLRDGTSDILRSTGGAMRHLVGDGEVLYADDMGADAVFVHDLARDRVRRFTRTDEKPNTIDLGADGRVLYVSNRGANNPQSYYLPGPEWGSVLAFDTATGEPLDAMVGGNQTTGLDVSDDGRFLAISDFLDDRVQVFEIPPYDELAAGDGGRFGAHRQDLAK